MSKFSIALYKPFHKRNWDLRIGKLGTDFQYHPLKITIEQLPAIPEGSMIPQESLLDIHHEDLLSLVDAFMEALEMAGLRQNTQATIAELKAVKYHLEDMRKLAKVNGK